MTVAYRGVSTHNSGNNPATLTLTQDIPSLTNGDYMLMALFANSQQSSPPQAPAGWTLLGGDVSGSFYVQVWAKVAWNEPGSYVVDRGAATKVYGGFVMAFYSTGGHFLYVDALATQVNGSSTNRTCPGVTTTKTSAGLACFFADGSSSSCTPPGDMTERKDNLLSSGVHAYAMTSILVASGATGDKVATSVATTSSKAITIALAETADIAGFAYTTLEDAALATTGDLQGGVVYRASSVSSATNSTTQVFNKPTGTLENDMMVLGLNIANTSGPTIVPTGWTLLQVQTGGSTRHEIYWKICEAAEPASWTFTFGSSVNKGGTVISVYSFTSLPLLINAYAQSIQSSASTDRIFPSVTTTVADTKLLLFLSLGVVTATTPPEDIQELTDTGAVLRLWAGIGHIPTAGATGTRTGTGLSSTNKTATVAVGELVPTSGTLAVTLEDATVAATGALAIKGSLSVTLQDATLAAVGSLSAVPSVGVLVRDYTITPPSSGTTLVVTKPSTVVEGDLMIMQIAIDETQEFGTASDPTGDWTVFFAVINSGMTSLFYYRIAGASEPASYTVTWPAPCLKDGAILALYGESARQPIITASNGSGSFIYGGVPSTDRVFASVNTTIENSLICCFAQLNVDTYSTPEVGAFELWDTYYPRMYCMVKRASSTGPTGDLAATGASAHFASVTVAVGETPAVPATPTSLTATAVSIGEIDLDWVDNADDETAYKVERSLDGTTGWTVIATLAADFTSYNDTGLAGDTTYYYRVRALNGITYSAYSSVASDTTFTLAPGSPTDLVATPINTSEIDLVWVDNSTDEYGFIIQQSANGIDWTTIFTTGPNVESYAVTSLVEGTEYYFQVLATGPGGDSDPTNIVDVGTFLAAPSDLTAEVLSLTEIVLDWVDNSSHESGFILERSPTGTSGWEVVTTLSPNVITYTDTGIPQGTTRYYRIKAFGTVIVPDSLYSSTASVLMPVEVPADLTATAVDEFSINLTWTDNTPGGNTFTVERSLTGSGSWTVIASGVISDSYLDTGLTPVTLYYYHVQSHVGAVDSEYSDIDSAETLEARPSPPYDLEVTGVSSTKIRIRWKHTLASYDTYISGFEVQRSDNNFVSSWVPITVPGSTTRTYTDTGLTPEMTYYYRVRSYRD